MIDHYPWNLKVYAVSHVSYSLLFWCTPPRFGYNEFCIHSHKEAQLQEEEWKFPPSSFICPVLLSFLQISHCGCVIASFAYIKGEWQHRFLLWFLNEKDCNSRLSLQIQGSLSMLGVVKTSACCAIFELALRLSHALNMALMLRFFLSLIIYVCAWIPTA